jgi:hypothetical protein
MNVFRRILMKDHCTNISLYLKLCGLQLGKQQTALEKKFGENALESLNSQEEESPVK